MQLKTGEDLDFLECIKVKNASIKHLDLLTKIQVLGHLSFHIFCLILHSAASRTTRKQIVYPYYLP